MVASGIVSGHFYDYSNYMVTLPAKDRILSAATQILAASGSGGLRIDSVAERAGVNKRMIYVHFGSRDGLVQLIRMIQLSNLLADSGLSESSCLILRELLGAPPSDTPAEIADQAARKLGVRITLSHLTELDAARWERFTARECRAFRPRTHASVADRYLKTAVSLVFDQSLSARTGELKDSGRRSLDWRYGGQESAQRTRYASYRFIAGSFQEHLAGVVRHS